MQFVMLVLLGLFADRDLWKAETKERRSPKGRRREHKASRQLVIKGTYTEKTYAFKFLGRDCFGGPIHKTVPVEYERTRWGVEYDGEPVQPSGRPVLDDKTAIAEAMADYQDLENPPVRTNHTTKGYNRSFGEFTRRNPITKRPMGM